MAKAKAENGEGGLPDGVPPVNATLLADPIGFLAAEHYRQRVICNTLDALIAGPVDSQGVADLLAIADYLTVGLALHVNDEEENLFPLLEKRAKQEPLCAEILGELRREHAWDRDLVASIDRGLRRVARRPAPGISPTLACAARTFAENKRRHLILENLYVLPMARQLLTARDLRGMAQALAARRDVPAPDGEADAGPGAASRD